VSTSERIVYLESTTIVPDGLIVTLGLRVGYGHVLENAGIDRMIP
jgi:hypothetical protein